MITNVRAARRAAAAAMLAATCGVAVSACASGPIAASCDYWSG